MKQLPGRARRRWLQLIVTGVLTAVATIWLVTLLPFLLLFSLVFAALLIPVMRRLRREMDEAGFHPGMGQWSGRRQTLDVTPWNQQLRNVMNQLLNNSPTIDRERPREGPALRDRLDKVRPGTRWSGANVLRVTSDAWF